MKKWRKALSVALASALLIPALTVTAFGSALGINGDLYDGYIKGNTTLGGNLTLTDPAARDLYNDLIFTSGAPGSASGSGYGSFCTHYNPTKGYSMGIGYSDPITGGDGKTHTLDELHPIGNIKWVLHNGVLVITNEGQAVSRAIDAAVERGSTLVDVTGSYSGLPRRMVMCACSNNEVFKVRLAAHQVDPGALVMICEASEVFGEGFRAPEVGEKTG